MSTKLQKRIAVAGVGLAAAGAAVAGPSLITRAQPAAVVPLGQPLDPAEPPQVLVFVSGAVLHPGLYRLSVDARGADALAAAGGLLPSADIGKLPDLAATLHDGRQLNVPFARSGSTATSAAKLDVNTASVDELQAVPGMPVGLADAIVQYRSAWGPFTSMADLRGALGIDAQTEAALNQYLRVVP